MAENEIDDMITVGEKNWTMAEGEEDRTMAKSEKMKKVKKYYCM